MSCGLRVASGFQFGINPKPKSLNRLGSRLVVLFVVLGDWGLPNT